MLNMNAGLVSSYWNPAAVWAQTGVVQGLSRWMTLSFPYHWRTCHGHTDTLRWWKKHDDTNPHGRHASFRCRNLVKALFSTLRVALVGQGRQVHVFLDRNRLEDGRMFSSDFARVLINSRNSHISLTIICPYDYEQYDATHHFPHTHGSRFILEDLSLRLAIFFLSTLGCMNLERGRLRDWRG